MRTRVGVVFAKMCLPCGLLHKWLTVSEAERMVSRGECTRKRVPSQRNPIYVLTPRVEPSKSLPTPSGMTADQMLAYIGIGSTRDISAAREKMLELQFGAWCPLPSYTHLESRAT